MVSPAALCDHYADAGFDVLAITDHWHVTDVEHDRLVVIPSSELTAHAPTAHGEAEALALGVSEFPEAREPFADPRGAGHLDRRARRCPRPLSSRTGADCRSEDVLSAPSLAGIEIWNGSAEVQQGNGLSTVHWDDALQRGPPADGNRDR